MNAIRLMVAAVLLGGQATLAATPTAEQECKLYGPATISEGVLDLREGGQLSFPHSPEFDLRYGFSITAWLRIDKPAQMPVPLSCGRWQLVGQYSSPGSQYQVYGQIAGVRIYQRALAAEEAKTVIEAGRP